jgi:hypothetical protein
MQSYKTIACTKQIVSQSNLRELEAVPLVGAIAARNIYDLFVANDALHGDRVR